MSLIEIGQALILVLFGVYYYLSRQAKKRPDVPWLQAFRMPELSEAQKRRQQRHRRTMQMMTGAQFILLGMALPFLYLFSTILGFFQEVNRTIFTWTVVAGIGLVALGIYAIWTSRNA